jgi:hypothetical protein
MDPLVQSALDAANQGDKPKAIELVRQALTANPNDMDAWLVLAAVMDDPQRKRQCLNRVLTIDPTNAIARDELLDMDRAYMSATAPQPVAAKPQPEPVQYSSYESAPAPQQTQFPAQTESPQRVFTPKPVSKPRLEKPLVFKYPLFWRILLYVFLFFFGCSGLLIATQNVINSLPFLGIALVIALTTLAFSPSVEVSQAGIRASGTFSSAEAKWDEIVRMKSNTMKRRLELYKKNGEVVNVSTQVGNYTRIVEIIRQTRPDLFSLASQSGRSTLSGMQASEPVFTGTKVFRKNTFAQYGMILLMVPLCLFGIWALVASDEAFVGIGVILVGLIFMLMSLFNVNQLKVEPGRITTESFFSQKEYTARQIRDITMKTVRSRQGIATNYVNIQPVSGGSIRLLGFSDGDEVIYGVLREWWEAHRNK